MLIYPSLFEGIGMPVLEAHQYGLPVVSSNAACLPEVGGDAALYFDPTSVEAIAEAIVTADRQPELLARLREATPNVLQRFCWPRAARTYVACYRAAAGRPLSEEQQALYDEAIRS